MMIQGPALDIARYLAKRANTGKGARTTYELVAGEIGWSHPTGRGLGKHLSEILEYCNERNLPALTTIVCKKGTSSPHQTALDHIKNVLGEVDIADEQQRVFAFDWSSVEEIVPVRSEVFGRSVWLTSFWGFDPKAWGCIGFANDAKRNFYIRSSKPGGLMVIYVTKGKGPERMRGKVVGVMEVSHRTGHAKEFISGDRWVEKEADPGSRDKWLYAVEVTRAWRIAEEDWQPIEKIFPKTYASSHPEYIGSQGVPVASDEIANLLHLSLSEVKVYGQKDQIDGGIQSLDNVLKPSRAVRPSDEPYWVGETDGPKYLYILKLSGDLSAYLGRPAEDLRDKLIVKVGFSKSPMTRRDQIQNAYPNGKFNWEVFYPKEVAEEPPYPNAEVAIAGEDAMKKRLQEDGGESLGGEFFLAEKGLVMRTWAAGKNAAEIKRTVSMGKIKSK